MLERLEVGVITSTHGLYGEVNVYPTTDDPARFSDLKEVLLVRDEDHDEDASSAEVVSVKFFKGRPIVRFRGIDRIEDAQRLRGYAIFVERKDAVPLEKDEYFIGDLTGSRVLLEDGTEYGILSDILTTAANDVYVILKNDGSTQYLPGVKEFIRKVDPEGKTIVVRVLKEL